VKGTVTIYVTAISATAIAFSSVLSSTRAVFASLAEFGVFAILH